MLVILRHVSHSLLLAAAVCQALPAQERQLEPLCPNLIASLATVPGNLQTAFAGQRVEVRQCPVEPHGGRGIFQLVAWQRDAYKPALVFNTEDSGFKQFAMIEGVYVFELMGGLSSRVVGIVYENGLPRIALRDSTRYKTLIHSQASKLIVEVMDADGQSRRYEFSRSDSGARR